MTLNCCGKCGTTNGIKALFCRQCGTKLRNRTFESAIDDPIKISRSLKRVRASGSLIIEASKKNRGDIDAIISQALESFAKTEPAGNELKEERQEEVEISPNDPMGTANPPMNDSGSTSHVTSPGNSFPSYQSVNLNTGPLMIRNQSTEMIASLPTVPNTGPLATIPQSQITRPATPTGPSIVLAHASGLSKRPRFGVKFYFGILLGVIILGAVTYFGFRNSLLSGRFYAANERNLIRVEDQSAEFVMLGEKERKAGNPGAAINYFLRALELTPNNPKVRMSLAQVKVQIGNVDDAIREYKTILKTAPDHLDARLQLADLYKSSGNKFAAYQEYQRIIALDHESSQAIKALAEIEILRDQFAASAINKDKKNNTGNKGFELDSEAFALKLPTGIQLNPSRQPNLVSTPGKSTSDSNPEAIIIADTHKKLGLRYLNVGENRAAINEFLSAVRSTPDDKDLFYYLGSAYYSLGQLATAHEYYRRVDKGSYSQVAQSGAQRTEKAYREEQKRQAEFKN